LHRFLDATASLKDRRWNNAEYLAAKYLVWQAAIYAKSGASVRGNTNVNPLEFLSVAPCIEDHLDISYRYVVRCDGNGRRPRVFVERMSGDEGMREIVKGEDGICRLDGKPLK